jgi:hypothetical protein
MKKIVLILIGIGLLFSCNLNMGSDPDSYDKSADDGDEIDYEGEYRTAVIQEASALTEGSTPEEIYNAGTAIKAAKDSNSIDAVRAVEIIEE